MSRLAVHRIPALNDNYVWLVVDEARAEAVAVDPSEPAPVERELARLGVRLVGIWNTHHHGDHVGGNLDLAAARPGLEIVASAHDWGRVPGQTRQVTGGDTFTFGGAEVSVLFIPGHTLGHIAYVVDGRLFCGDTLFGACCGRLFEGTPAQMHASLAELRALPDDTWVHCGHEYTRGCLRFAAELDPENGALAARRARVEAAPTEPTIPSRLGEEKATNPFLRWDAPAIRAAAGVDAGASETDVFAAIRKRKDGWRG